MDCSMPGFPDLHYLPEFAQTHVHWVGDAIQPSHPLSPPFPPVFNLSQHQGLFQWVGSLNQVAKGLGASVSVLPMNIQGWFPLGWLVRFPCSPQDSQESSPAPHLESNNSSGISLLYDPSLTSVHNYWKTIFLTICRPLSTKHFCFLIHCLGLSKRKWNLSLFPFSHLFPMKSWDWMPWSSFLNVEFQASFFTLLFHPHQEAL